MSRILYRMPDGTKVQDGQRRLVTIGGFQHDIRKIGSWPAARLAALGIKKEIHESWDSDYYAPSSIEVVSDPDGVTETHRPASLVPRFELEAYRAEKLAEADAAVSRMIDDSPADEAALTAAWIGTIKPGFQTAEDYAALVEYVKTWRSGLPATTAAVTQTVDRRRVQSNYAAVQAMRKKYLLKKETSLRN